MTIEILIVSIVGTSGSSLKEIRCRLNTVSKDTAC